MLFVKLKNSDIWYRYTRGSDRVYNYRGGWCGSTDCGGIEIEKEYDSWHELYKEIGYCPVKCDSKWYPRDCWLSPDGTLYDGDAHEVRAEEICEIIFNVTDIFHYDDYLMERGWVKLTTSLMLQIYVEEGMYRHLTYEQKFTIKDWADKYDRYDIIAPYLN